jgi:general secretion pathway protein L
MALSEALNLLRMPTLARAGAWLNALLARWHEALVACLPAPLQRVLAHRDERLVLSPQDGKALIWRQSAAGRQRLGELEPGAPGALRAMLATRRGRARVEIALAREDVITRTVTFPAQVRNKLVQVVGYEIDRLTPFRPDQVCFDFRLRDVAPQGERLEVELAVCRRDLIQGWIDRLRTAGAQPERVTWEGAWPKADLLPGPERARRGASVLSLNRLLFLLVVVLTAAVLASTLWQQGTVLEQRETELEALKAEAEEVFEVRAAIERARQGSLAVLERKSEQPRMTELLRELTEQLPDDTWVQNLDVNGTEVQIRGESAQAAALIGLLDQAAEFTDVAFRSPVVQVATTGQERFHIAFRLVREPPP